MKFKYVLNEENFISKTIRKIASFATGNTFSYGCKKERPRHPKIVSKFFNNGYRYLFSENANVWGGVSNFYCFINQKLDKLVYVYTGDGVVGKFIIFENDHNLLNPSYAIQSGNILETIPVICNDNESQLEIEENPKRVYEPFLFRYMLDTSENLDRQKTDMDFELEAIKSLTGNLVPNSEIPTESLVKAVQSGCSLSQLLLFVRIMFAGNLSERDCITVASKYYV